MAFFTLSFFIRPVLDRFSISSLFVEPEQYHAIDMDFRRTFVCDRAAPLDMKHKGGSLYLKPM